MKSAQNGTYFLFFFITNFKQQVYFQAAKVFFFFQISK